ncbi:hypothetical protein HC928_04700 [bacterium]|nr:hypothetical protein [bacterium]
MSKKQVIHNEAFRRENVKEVCGSSWGWGTRRELRRLMRAAPRPSMVPDFAKGRLA